MKTLVKVGAYIDCPEDPILLLGKPIGMYHCPVCACMVIAGMAHPPCLLGECMLTRRGRVHPGKLTTIEVEPEFAEAFGLKVIE